MSAGTPSRLRFAIERTDEERVEMEGHPHE